MHARILVRISLVLALFCAAGGNSLRAAHTLVGDPFIGPYNNWVDTWVDGVGPAGPTTWGIHLLDDVTLMENRDTFVGTGVNTGTYTPFILLQDSVTTGSEYSVSSRMMTSDDDGFGLVFGYQDADNYFRVGMREQANSNTGFTQGLAVQKVVGGVTTQISPAVVGPGDLSVPTQSMIDNRTPIDITVDVNGSDWSVSVAGLNGGAPLISGTDSDLSGGKAGVMSWAQRNDTGNHPRWGTEVDSFVIRDATGAELFNDDFTAASPVAWRELHMTNQEGGTLPTATANGADGFANFNLRFNNTIQDDSNVFAWATETAPNLDFIGEGIVVNEPGSENFADYEMRVRMANEDNDGGGVLVRVQDDDTFYRINFAAEAMGDSGLRAPAGLSVQKVLNGDWSPLFLDTQGSELFLPGDGVPFDLSVKVVGNSIQVQVINDPDGAATVIDYPLITDDTDPLLTGTVGLHNWGSGGGAHGGLVWSAYGGSAGPLLVHIPEPSTIALALLAGLGLFGWSRRRA